MQAILTTDTDMHGPTGVDAALPRSSSHLLSSHTLPCALRLG